MKPDRNHSRSPADIATALGGLVEEGRVLLEELLEPEKRSATATLRDAFDEAGRRISEFQSSATRVAKHGKEEGARYMRQADRYAHDNPWPIAAAGILVGVVAALLFAQRR